VLGNHGLAVAAETVEEADALLGRVVAALSRPVCAAAPVDRAPLERLCAGSAYRPAEMDETHALATDPLALSRGESLVFYPDHVVFLGVGVATDMAGDPPLVAIPGVGVVIRQDAKPAIEPMGRCLADVMRRVEKTDPLVALTDADVDRLVNWDAEKYRQTLKV
jgi:rhamnose utilization protein RhaD (predicted bifunctional aldolase and dehydrogenase)